MPEKPVSGSLEEMARIGDEVYETQVRPVVEAGNFGRVVAIDVKTGVYELGDTALDAVRKLLERSPDAKIWSVRIGHRALYHIGASFMSRKW